MNFQSKLNLDNPLRHLTTEEITKLSDNSQLVSEFWQRKLEQEAKKNWDLFYKRNETKFFRDRHWTKREFEELIGDDFVSKEDRKKRTLLEVGCGVGNFIWPLIEEKTDFYIYATDFSPRAIEFVKKHFSYDEQNSCTAFLSDISIEGDLIRNMPASIKINVASLIFVLSAIHPTKMTIAIKNIYDVLNEDGIVLFRDYGLFDHAQLRFSSANKLADNFYVRQDGTRTFYFSVEFVQNMFKACGFKVISCDYVQRETINKKEAICVPRIFVQGKFIKCLSDHQE